MVFKSSSEPIKVIISFCLGKDRILSEALEERVAVLKPIEDIQIYLMPIENVGSLSRSSINDLLMPEEADKNLREADIVLLLITPSYRNSENYAIFTQRILPYQNSPNPLTIIPVLGKPVDSSFFETNIGKLSPLPRSKKFLPEGSKDRLFAEEIIPGIRTTIKEIREKRKKREKQKQEYELKLSDFEQYVEENTLEGHSLSDQLFRFKPEGLKRDLKQEDMDTLISTVYERSAKEKQLYSQKLISYENKFYEVYKKEGSISNKNRAELYGFAHSLGLTSEDIEICEERIIHQIESEKETIIQKQKVPDISSPQPDSSPKSKLPLIVALLIAFLVGFVPIPGLKSLGEIVSSWFSRSTGTGTGTGTGTTKTGTTKTGTGTTKTGTVPTLKCYRILDSQALNVRGEAGWASSVIFQLSSEETSVRSFGETASIDGETWIKIFDKERQGWIAKEFLSRAYCGSW